MKRFVTKIPFLFLYFFITISLSASTQDSIIANKLGNIQHEIDSMEIDIGNQQKNINDLAQKCSALDRVSSKNENRISITDLLAILLSCITLIYVVRADRINSLFGSYQGKKRYKTNQKQIGELCIRLDEIKSDFKEINEAEPSDFVKNGKKELDKLERVLDKAIDSKYYYHSGDSQQDNRDLIYETRPSSDPEIVYRFNEHVIAIKNHCKNIIRETQRRIDEKIRDTKIIRYGEED